jgi:hypothetical protein
MHFPDGAWARVVAFCAAPPVEQRLEMLRQAPSFHPALSAAARALIDARYEGDEALRPRRTFGVQMLLQAQTVSGQAQAANEAEDVARGAGDGRFPWEERFAGMRRLPLGRAAQ